MSMHPTTARTPPGHHDHDSIVRLHDVPWDEFEGLIAARGESPTPRVAYLAGELELVSPSRNHEAIKSMFGRLIEAWAEETGVDLQAYGSWLIKKKRARRGAEPDECYVVGLHTSAAPDLVIEVAWTSGGLDKLAIYAPLGVREVWIWRDGAVTVHVLRTGEYAEAARSTVLPALDLGVLLRFLDEPNQTAAVRAYRRLLREGAP